MSDTKPIKSLELLFSMKGGAWGLSACVKNEEQCTSPLNDTLITVMNFSENQNS